MNATLANFFSFNLMLVGVGLLTLVLGVEKHVFVWKRQRCPTCGRAHQGGCRRHGS